MDAPEQTHATKPPVASLPVLSAKPLPAKPQNHLIKVNKIKTIGPQMVGRILPWVETFYHDRRRYPNNSEFINTFDLPLARLLELQHHAFYKQALKSRGIIQNIDNLGFPSLSPEQVATISVMTNFVDSRSMAAKLVSLGVSDEQYNGWLVNDEFKRQLHSRADEVLDNVYPEAQAALVRNIKAGNMGALKFYYEVTGRANSPEAQNVKQLLQLLIEAVQKHVKDPAVLQLIATDFAAVTSLKETSQHGH